MHSFIHLYNFMHYSLGHEIKHPTDLPKTNTQIYISEELRIFLGKSVVINPLYKF